MKKVSKIIVIFLILIIISNSLFPIFSRANTKIDTKTNLINVKLSETEIKFNRNLYLAIKNSLNKDNIKFRCNDLISTIDITNDLIEKVVKLDLRNFNLDDLTGISLFKNLKEINLSNNKLSSKSNLEELNGLSLTYLNLSNNKLEDVSKIENLLNDIKIRNGKVNLTQQDVRIFYDIVVDKDNINSDYVEIKLPLILEKAGNIDESWCSGTKERIYASAPKGIEEITEYITMIDKITSENNTIKVKVTNSFEELEEQLITLKIYIHDTAKLNDVSFNVLKDSKFTFNIIVHDKELEAVYLPDKNFYDTVRSQLTANQIENSKLDSYKFENDLNGDLVEKNCAVLGIAIKQQFLLTIVDDIYENFDLSYYEEEKVDQFFNYIYENYEILIPEENVKKLLNIIKKYIDNNMALEPESVNFYGNSNVSVKVTISEIINELLFYDKKLNQIEKFDFENEEFKLYSKDFKKSKLLLEEELTGLDITMQAYLVKPLNINSINLYEKNFDEAQILVIEKNVINNKINSLVLNNKGIVDLTGIEKFTNLEENINLSSNNLKNIDPLYKMDENNLKNLKFMNDNYQYYLKGNAENLTNKYNKILDNFKKIKEISDGLITTSNKAIDIVRNCTDIQEYITVPDKKVNSDGTITTVYKSVKNPDYEKRLDEICNQLDDFIEKNLDLTKENDIYALNEENNNNIKDLYDYINKLYKIDNDMYKEISLLPDDLAYVDECSFKGKEKEMTQKYIDRILFLNDNKALKEIDILMIALQFYDEFQQEPAAIQENEDEIIREILKDVMRRANNPSDYIEIIKKIKEIDIYSKMLDYGLLERMNHDGYYDLDFYKEFLNHEIKTKTNLGLSSEIENKILENFENDIIDVRPSSISLEPKGNLVNGINSIEVYGNLMDDGLSRSQLVNFLVRMYMLYSWKYEDIFEEGNPRAKEAPKIKNVCNTSKAYGKYYKINGLEYFCEFSKGQIKNNNFAYSSQFYYIQSHSSIKKLVNCVDFCEYIQDEYGDRNYCRDFYEDDTLINFKELLCLCNRIILEDDGKLNVDRFKIKDLNISNNAYLSGLNEIHQLSDIEKLDVSSIYLSNIDELNLENFRNLISLNLENNYISNIKQLEDLEYIEEVNLKNNLLKGNLEFDFNKCDSHLKQLDLSGNQIDDISSFMYYADYKTNGNLSNYINIPEKINVNFNDQIIEKDIRNKEILLDENPDVIDIELPPIFSQLIALDGKRIAFAGTSKTGKVNYDGKYVTLLTLTPGEKQGYVRIIPMSSNGIPEKECLGNGTNIVIKYNVLESKTPIEKDKLTIDIDPKLNIKPGEMILIIAKVNDEIIDNVNVKWEVLKNTSNDTKITEDGKLIIAKDEKSSKILIIAKLKEDESIQANKELIIEKDDESVEES